MSIYDVYDAFTNTELHDVEAAAQERGVSVFELIHDAVVNDLVR